MLQEDKAHQIFRKNEHFLPPDTHTWKVSVFGDFLERFLLLFGRNTGISSVNFCIQLKCGKINTRKTPNTDTFYATSRHFFDNFWCLMIYHKVHSGFVELNNSGRLSPRKTAAAWLVSWMLVNVLVFYRYFLRSID